MNNEIDVAHNNDGDSSLEVLPPARPPMQSAMAILRQHAEMMDTAYQLAKAMCATQMVPDRFKGKPHDGAAAILYGAELGLNPIQSLQRIIAIHGMPSLEARTMVALLKARGYQFNWISKSDTRCAFEGWSPDGNDHETSTWTIEDATKRGYVPTIDEQTGKYRLNARGNLIGNEKYLTDPQAMLKAKCQAEVCRDLAPDILLGISYSREDLESEPAEQLSAQATPPVSEPVTAEEILADVEESTPAEIARERIAKQAKAAGFDAVAEAMMSGVISSSAGSGIITNPVVGQPHKTTIPESKPLNNTIDKTTETPDTTADGPQNYEHDPRDTRDLFALLRRAGIENDNDNKWKRLTVYRFLTGRPEIGSTNNVSPQELADIITTLHAWDRTKKLTKQVDEILLAVAEDAEDQAREAERAADENA